tara:strand:+ start:1027 stop:3045 length:2019 start_codon:yes stop_codon:yes gene_type:complete
MSGSEKLSQVYSELLVAKDRGELSPKGATLLQAIEGGQLLPNALGAGLAGLSMNFSDEAIGSLRGFFGGDSDIVAEATGMTPVEAGRELERFGQQQYSDENPATSFASELAGASIPAIVTRGKTAPESLLMAGTKSFGAGALGGYGASEGDVTQQAKETGVGGALALAVTPALKVIGNLGGKLYRSATDALFTSPDRLGVDAARTLLKEAIENDAGTIDEALAMVLSKQGKGYALADIGPNTRAYLDAANVLPSPSKKIAKDFLEKRDKGSLERLTSDIQQAFGSKAAFFDEFNALKQARSALGQKLYGRALKKQIPVSEQFTELLKRPSMAQAFERAKAIAAESGVDLPDVFLQNGKLMTKTGEVTAVDTKLLHYMKMGLDDLVFTGKSPTSGLGSTQLGSIKKTRSQFLNFIDENNKTYKVARDYWASDTAAMDAMQSGRNFFRIDPDELASDLRQMSRSEKEAFRLGAMQQVMDKIGGAQVGETIVSPVGNTARNLLKDPKNVRLMRMTFPEGDAGDKTFKKFIGNLTDEVEVRTTSMQVLGGSQTATRQEAVKSIRDRAESQMPQGQTPMDLFMNMLGKNREASADAQLSSTASELTRMLTETDPTRLNTIGRQIAGNRPVDAVRKAPELIPALGRAATSPYAIGSMSGQYADPAERGVGGLLQMFGR